MRRLVNGTLIGIVIGVLGVLLTLRFDAEKPSWGELLERDLALPILFKVRGEIEPPRDVAVIAINNSTARELGLPPLPRDWPRSIHARLIERLVARGASVIVFDVYFAREKSLDDDRRLADAAKGLAPFPLPKEKLAVTTFWAFKESAKDMPMMPAMALQLHMLDLYEPWVALLEQAGAAGAEALPRRPADFMDPENRLGEKLSEAEKLRGLMRQLRRIFQGDPDLKARVLELLERQPEPAVSAADRPRLRALASLYDGSEFRYLNFYGAPGTIETIDYHLLFAEGENGTGGSAIDLTGKVVFVGSSDIYFAEQPDRFYTAFTNRHGVDLSGVEIMATAFGNLLTDRSLRSGDRLATVLMLFAFGLALGVALYLLPAVVSAPLALVLMAGYVFEVVYAFSNWDLWLPAAVPVLVQLPLALFFGLGGQYLIERGKKQHVSKAIGYYLPENIVKDLSEKGLDPSTLNQVVSGTCLATDMSGFTTISEKMAPEQLADFMNDYFDSLAQPLKRNGVDVTEFHADSIMCAWTATESSRGSRRNAVSAALEVADAIGLFSQRHANLRLRARIGLEDGRFYLGHTGGGGQFAYSILGDCANTASRIEGLNKHLGTRILATQGVMRGLDGVLQRPLGWFRFVGKSDPTPVVEVITRRPAASEAQLRLCDDFAAGIELFRARRWARAAAVFRSISRAYPDDGPARFYLARCQQYRAEPPRGDDPSIIQMDAK